MSRMTPPSISDTVRQGRLAHGLSQADLAQKLGMRQSQISDLERGVIDPRLSTVQDVSRILDLELMLVPRQLVLVVDGMIRAKDRAVENRPLYALQQVEEAEEGGAAARRRGRIR